MLNPFGLWAAAAPQKATLAKGVENADSWATTHEDVDKSVEAILRIAARQAGGNNANSNHSGAP